jgi:hypothetical protein
MHPVVLAYINLFYLPSKHKHNYKAQWHTVTSTHNREVIILAGVLAGLTEDFFGFPKSLHENSEVVS